MLLDPEIEVGVFRGGVVEHPRYAGRRIFGAGINLTHLYRGLVSYLFYFVRDLGYVNKLYRGLSAPEWQPGELQDSTEKLWIAAAETYAIGGACQLLHVMDHVIAERGCRLLPARAQGGDHPRRLQPAPAARGRRPLARQAILSGREFEAGTPEGDLLCDEIVEPGEMDAAIERARRALTSSGLVNAAANRRAMRVGAGAARRLPRLHGRLRARAGRLPLQPRAGRATSSATGTRRNAPSVTSSARRASSLRALQLERLRATVGAAARRASRSRASACTTPASRSAEDDRLARRPAPAAVHRRRPTCASTTRSGCWRCRASELVRVHASSGTGGKPTVVGYTPARPRHRGPR